jgi:hypothetical protein
MLKKIQAVRRAYGDNFGFGNLLYFSLRAAQIPWAYSIPLVRGAKTITHPRQHIRRKSLARRLLRAPSAFSDRVNKVDGYWLFGPDELPGAKAVAAECRTIFQGLQSSGALQKRASNLKEHLRPIVKADELAQHPEIGRFALSRPVLEGVTAYFGSVPVLSSICLLWSVKNQTITSSQQYHFDGEDFRQLKLFINVWDINDEHGPLTFYPAATSAAILQRGDRKQRLESGNLRFEDEFVLAGANGQRPVRVVGEAGAGVFVDTSRCIHYGSRCNTKERLMLMLQYAPYNMARETFIGLGSSDWIPFDRTDELQRLALRK